MIVHGAYGHPGENWFPWLKKELELAGCRVVVPQFSTPQQHLEQWMETAERQRLPPDAILIGHSIGATFLLAYLEKHQAMAAFLVSGFVGPLGLELDPINKEIAERDFQWENIRHNCRRRLIFHGDNDPYVPLAKAEEIANHLHTPLTVIPGGGHLNASAGFTRFDALLDAVKKL